MSDGDVEDILAKYTASQPTQEKQGVLSRAMSNLPRSAGKFADDMTYMFRHPADTFNSIQ